MQNLNDIVFKIDNQAADKDDFSFVHLKIKDIELVESGKENKKRTLIQIIDMSGKILYNEAKAE